MSEGIHYVCCARPGVQLCARWAQISQTACLCSTQSNLTTATHPAHQPCPIFTNKSLSPTWRHSPPTPRPTLTNKTPAQPGRSGSTALQNLAPHSPTTAPPHHSPPQRHHPPFTQTFAASSAGSCAARMTERSFSPRFSSLIVSRGGPRTPLPPTPAAAAQRTPHPPIRSATAAVTRPCNVSTTNTCERSGRQFCGRWTHVHNVGKLREWDTHTTTFTLSS